MSDHCDRVEESMKGKDVLTNAPSPEENAPVNSEEALMEWKCFEDKHNLGDWRQVCGLEWSGAVCHSPGAVEIFVS
jgi:hypothetical protein